MSENRTRCFVDAAVAYVNDAKKYVSSFDMFTQCAVARSMWRDIQENMVDIQHRFWSSKEYDSSIVEEAYSYMEDVKIEFADELFRQTGVRITWRHKCLLCDQYQDCYRCPLKCCSQNRDNPFYTIMKYLVGQETLVHATEACDKILDAIEGLGKEHEKD